MIKKNTREADAPKIGIFVVAYNAENTISNTLSRIKPHTWSRISEVFIFDDCSADKTSEVATLYKENCKPGDKIRLFKNQVNLGYGGNQKRGYSYTILNKFDIVIMLHGDGQYAPEVMDSLIDPIVRGEADAVFGSRMIIKGQALEGNMPLYKFVGNKILTCFQNTMMNKRMSEYHSGYRAYSVHALKKIPFMRNSNDFHFDNEIIVQFFEAGFLIKEVPIPTYYGDEICYVNGLRYAWNVVKTIIAYRMHKAGLLYAKQFDIRGGYKYSFKHHRYSSHKQILKMLPQADNKKKLDILDLGCGAGLLATQIASMGHTVVGVDIYDNVEARQYCSQFIVSDIEQDFGLDPKQRFDYIILADILEHVRNPERVLLRARRYLKDGGRILSSTGNVANICIRLALLFGRFTYTERGILDRTHCRLMTSVSLRKLFQDCGFRVIRTKATPIPFEVLIPGQEALSGFLTFIYMISVWIKPSLFAYQLLTEALPDSKATELLREEELLKPSYEEWKPEYISKAAKLLHKRSLAQSEHENWRFPKLDMG